MAPATLGIEPRDRAAASSRRSDALDELCQLRDMRLPQPSLSRADCGLVGEQLRCRRLGAEEVHLSKLRSGCDNDGCEVVNGNLPYGERSTVANQKGSPVVLRGHTRIGVGQARSRHRGCVHARHETLTGGVVGA